MKCPKCGFVSFDYLDTCKKCGLDLHDHKAKLGITSTRSSVMPTRSQPSPVSTPTPAVAPKKKDVRKKQSGKWLSNLFGSIEKKTPEEIPDQAPEQDAASIAAEPEAPPVAGGGSEETRPAEAELAMPEPVLPEAQPDTPDLATVLPDEPALQEAEPVLPEAPVASYGEPELSAKEPEPPASFESIEESAAPPVFLNHQEIPQSSEDLTGPSLAEPDTADEPQDSMDLSDTEHLDSEAVVDRWVRKLGSGTYEPTGEEEEANGFETEPVSPVAPEAPPVLTDAEQALPDEPASLETEPVSPVAPEAPPVLTDAEQALPDEPVSLETEPVSPVAPEAPPVLTDAEQALPDEPVSLEADPVSPVAPETPPALADVEQALPDEPVSLEAEPVSPVAPETPPVLADAEQALPDEPEEVPVSEAKKRVDDWTSELLRDLKARHYSAWPNSRPPGEPVEPEPEPAMPEPDEVEESVALEVEPVLPDEPDETEEPEPAMPEPDEVEESVSLEAEPALPDEPDVPEESEGKPEAGDQQEPEEELFEDPAEETEDSTDVEPEPEVQEETVAPEAAMAFSEDSEDSLSEDDRNDEEDIVSVDVVETAPSFEEKVADVVRQADEELIEPEEDEDAEIHYVEKVVEKSGFTSRAVALLIDMGIIGSFLSICLGIGGLVMGVFPSSESGGPDVSEYMRVLALPSYLLLLIMTAIYFVFFHGSSGQTIGKMVVGARVVDTDGNILGYARAFLRYVGWLFSTIVFFLGFVWAAFDFNKQGWHDKLAHSCVIKTRTGKG